MIGLGVGPLKGTTFVIPLRADSGARLRNVAYVVAYLTTVLDATVIVQEVDSQPRFAVYGSRFLAPILPNDAKFHYLFQQERRSDGAFHRTRVLNDMILRTSTPIVVNYDADVVLPVDSYYDAVSRLQSGRADIVYPYPAGPEVQRRVFATDETMIEFAGYGYALRALDIVSTRERSAFGHCQFFRREVYVEGYLENENFIAYGPEDVERYYRFCKFGYRVERLKAPIYHLEHPRSPNSTPENPYMARNVALWDELRLMPPEALAAYYERQLYVWARRHRAVGLPTIDLSRGLAIS